MKFVQTKKFSYLIQLYFGLSEFQIKDISTNEAIYANFLKSVLVENVISFSFLCVAMYQLLFYLDVKSICVNFRKNENVSFSKKNSVFHSNLFNSELDQFKHSENALQLLKYIKSHLCVNFIAIKSKYAPNGRSIDLIFKFQVHYNNISRSSEISLDSPMIETLIGGLIRYRANVSNMSLSLSYHNVKLNYLYKIDYSLSNFESNDKMILKYKEYNPFSIAYILMIGCLVLFAIYFLIEETIELWIYKFQYFAFLLNWVDLMIILLLIKHIYDCILINKKVDILDKSF